MTRIICCIGFSGLCGSQPCCFPGVAFVIQDYLISRHSGVVLSPSWYHDALNTRWPSLLSPQFFSDARDLESFLRNLQDSIKRKYSCDHSTSLSRLEDLLQDSMVGVASVGCLLLGSRVNLSAAAVHILESARAADHCCKVWLTFDWSLINVVLFLFS